jgi:glycosyltransferase involved in cell wall biosynthesis
MALLPTISIVVPLFNEEALAIELNHRLIQAVSGISENWEIVYINDGSRDNTLSLLRQFAKQEARVRYISFSRNFGHQIAISAGIQHARAEAIVIIDGDLQDPPELIPALYSKYKEGFEVVYAKRTQRKGESWFKLFTAKLFYRLLRSITSVDIPVDVGDFRIIDHKVAEQLNAMPERNKYIRGQIAWIGFRSSFVEYDRDARKAGETNYPFKKMLRFAVDGITAFSDAPLKFVTRLGFFVSGLAFLIIVYALYAHWVLDKTITGWTSIIISTMFIGGIQLISIGIIGEYISRINDNVRQRPLYIIGETNIEK